MTTPTPLKYIIDAEHATTDKNKTNLFVMCAVPFLCAMILFAIQDITNISIACQSTVKLAIQILAVFGAATYILPVVVRPFFVILCVFLLCMEVYHAITF